MNPAAVPGRHVVPDPTVARLPLYRRALERLAGREVTSVLSRELADAVGVNPATVRRDLSHLGTLGVRGSGYEVETVLQRIGRALAIGRDWPIAIVGAGNLGRALARSQGFRSGGFRVAAILDVDSGVVGHKIAGVAVSHLDGLESVVETEHVAIGVITTPAAAAQDIAARLAACGVRSLLNFAPSVLALPIDVRVRHVDLSAELEVLAFHGARDPADPPPNARPTPATS